MEEKVLFQLTVSVKLNHKRYRFAWFLSHG